MLRFALAIDLLVFLLACAGMMVVFLGGGGYLPVLLVLLALSLPVSLLQVGAGVAWFLRRGGLRVLWQNLPQWLAVTFWLALGLVACGELALLVTLQLAGTPPRLWQHLPLLAGSGAALAYCVIDALMRARASLARG